VSSVSGSPYAGTAGRFPSRRSSAGRVVRRRRSSLLRWRGSSLDWRARRSAFRRREPESQFIACGMRWLDDLDAVPPVNDAGGHPIACEQWAGGSAPACRPGTRTRRPARRADGRGWPSRRPRRAGAPWRRGYRQAARFRRAPTGSGRRPRGEVGLHAVRGWRSDGSTCAMKYGGPAPASIGRSVTKSRSLIVRRWLARTLTLVRPAPCLPLSRPANERGAQVRPHAG
jgi:hypothetical protein